MPQISHQLEIPGMELLREIGRGSHSTVYQATHQGRTFAIKVQHATHPDAQVEAALRFRREAAILARIHHPGLTEIMEVGEIEGQAYLVMEYVEGRTLASRLAEGTLPEDAIIALAMRLASALAAVHRHGLVHRDVKPQNILLDQAEQAWLIDFGLAGQTHRAPATDGIVGTFLYSAPEQSGMLKRPVDGRSDLYALGVVLFECATGQPPFQANDVGELIRQHAVVVPASVRELNPAISPALSAIIARLLSKDPNDRYQSGSGLVADLALIDELNAAIQAGQAPPLARQDAPQPLDEAPLIGREGELQQLESQWERAQQGAGALLLVEGPAGSGKSRLVEEFLRGVRAGDVKVLSGSSREEESIPLAPLREALTLHLQQIRRLPKPQRRQAEERVRQAAGEFAPLLKHLSPEMALLFQEVVELPESEQGPTLFYDAVARFLVQLATARGPGVLFLDGVQWLDEASRQVLGRVASQTNELPLLVIAAGRNGIRSREALERLVGQLGDTLHQRLPLPPLTDKAMAQLIAADLGNLPVEPELVHQITSRTQGNPFFVAEYIRLILEAGLLRPSWGRWLAELEALKQLDLPTDMLHLALRRLDTLTPQARELLRAAAILGSRFGLDLLLAITALGEEALYAALAEATQAHLVERTESDEYHFTHDQLREALLSELGERQCRQLHQRAAEALEQRGSTEEEASIYAMARHYAQGETTQTPTRLVEANLAAGKLAIRSHADEKAYTFLMEAHQVAQAVDLPPNPDLDEALGRTCIATSRWAQAIEHQERAIAATEDPLKRAELRVRVVRVYLTSNFDVDKAQAQLELAFAEVEEPVPPWEEQEERVSERFLEELAYREDKPEEELGERERERLRILVLLYDVARYAAFLRNRQGLMLHLAIRELEVAQRLGPSSELVRAYRDLAIILARRQHMELAEHCAWKMVGLDEQMGDPRSLASSRRYHAMLKHIQGRSREAEALQRQCLERHGQWMDSTAFMDGVGDFAWNLLMRGYAREAWSWIHRGMVRHAHSQSGAQQGHPYLWCFAVPTLAVLGRTTESLEHLKKIQEFLSTVPETHALQGFFLGFLILFYLEQGELGAPLEEAIQKFHDLGVTPPQTTFHRRHFYLAQAHARLAQCLHLGIASLTPYLATLRAALDELREIDSPPALHCHTLAIEGALLGLEGQHEAALARLEEAESTARAVDSPWGLFEVFRNRARVLMWQGNHALATREAYFAQTLAVEQEWSNRARWLRSEFQLSDTTRSMGGSISEQAGISSTSSQSLRLHRYFSALQQVSLASSRVLDPEAQARAALDEIVKLLGAQRAFLFWCDETERLTLKAGRDAEGNDLTELRGYSATVVEQVRASRQPLVISGTDEGTLLGSESIVVHDLRSILAAPLMMQERLVGVLYLDNRLAGGIFTREDVDILLAIGNHIAIALEMAETIKTQAELERLQEMDRIKSQFFASVSHELRTPLNAIIGFSRLMIKGYNGPVTEQQLRDLSSIHAAGKHLLALINDILDLTRISAGKMELAQESTELQGLFEEALATAQPLVGEKPIRLLDEAGPLPPVFADRQRVYQVLLNLLSNAIKFTDQGSVTLGASANEGWVTICVTDTGPGIPPEKVESIFQEFSQVEAAHSKVGTGLGLPISRRLVELHGGRLWVQSKVQQGSAFCFTLPVDVAGKTKEPRA